MTATKLDGRATRDAIFSELAERVSTLADRGVTPGLGTVLVGDDPGSHSYVRGKHKACEKVGIASIRRDLPAETSQDELEAVIDELNADPACHGYLVQLPLPKHLDAGRVLERVDPAKDADGLHPTNLGKLVLGDPAPLPCTPSGIVTLLRRYDVPIAGAHVAVIGRGVTVGRPLGLLLTRRSENATVTLCHTGTKDLAAEVRRADIVVAAAGTPGLITPDLVRPGAAVLDVGITRTEQGLVGDVHPDVAEVASHLAPVPGGVGPMTIAMLLRNVVQLAERLRRVSSDAVEREPRHGRHERRRRRWLTGYLVHLPFAVVLLVAAGGILRIVQYHWRGGSTLLGIALLLAALLRGVLADDEVGLLAIRSKPPDVLTYAGFGLLVIAVALTIVGGPFA